MLLLFSRIVIFTIVLFLFLSSNTSFEIRNLQKFPHLPIRKCSLLHNRANLRTSGRIIKPSCIPLHLNNPSNEDMTLSSTQSQLVLQVSSEEVSSSLESSIETETETRGRNMKWSQQQDLEEILSERARRFYSPTAGKTLSADGRPRERCILVTVDRTTTGPGTSSTPSSSPIITSIEMPKFSCEESLEELCELVGTAGLVVAGCLIQRLPQPHSQSYIGSGKIKELADLIKAPLPISSSNSDLLPQDDEITVVVVDDDLTPKQQRNLEDGLQSYGVPANVKVLDRTAIILEIFAQHAQSKEGQLQVELAMLQYRLNRGPKARGGHYDSGCGFRGPGETKLETDKRIIRDKIVQLKHDIDQLSQHRLQHRVNRLKQLHLPVVALVGYTNAGKSTLMNKISHAGVLAENMLFATLDPTTRKVVVPKIVKKKNDNEEGESESEHESHKGQEILLTDTVGFISKLPTHLIAAFR